MKNVHVYRWMRMRADEPAFRFTCMNCHGRFTHPQSLGWNAASNRYEVTRHFADLNGEAFKAYYCAACAQSLGAERPDA